jgi:hypothetical protein
MADPEKITSPDLGKEPSVPILNEIGQTKEEKADQDTKLRPERAAKFGDYLVCTSLYTFLSAVKLISCSSASSRMRKHGISRSWHSPPWLL